MRTAIGVVLLALAAFQILLLCTTVMSVNKSGSPVTRGAALSACLFLLGCDVVFSTAMTMVHGRWPEILGWSLATLCAAQGIKVLSLIGKPPRTMTADRASRMAAWFMILAALIATLANYVLTA
jgi:hypothetical protein